LKLSKQKNEKKKKVKKKKCEYFGKIGNFTQAPSTFPSHFVYVIEFTSY